MSETSLKFGTSGLRGLVTDLQGAEARRYGFAFFTALKTEGQTGSGKVYLAHDLRTSGPAILNDCAAAAIAAGLHPIDCGLLPTPALALEAMANSSPAIMITGSHIPADRNGLKFYTPKGEITKADEAAILAHLPDTAPPSASVSLPNGHADALTRYRARYTNLLPQTALSGLRIGVFEHSTVLRDLLGEMLSGFGAEIITLGRSDNFVAVDTEAFSDAVFAPLPGWVAAHRLDCLVSADGDGDRPLVMDETGAFLRGDALGLLTAHYLDAECLVTPVSSSSGIDASGFAEVIRTKIGSPYVISGMAEAVASGAHRVIGFEANGGTLLGTAFPSLPALPTRDAVLPILAVLGTIARQNIPLSRLASNLALPPALSDRLTDIAPDRSAALIETLAQPDAAAAFFSPRTVAAVSAIDGLRFTLDDGAIVHIRPSGNAPELRCYIEAETKEKARALLDWALAKIAKTL